MRKPAVPQQDRTYCRQYRIDHLDHEGADLARGAELTVQRRLA